jgi:AcrR family transcriptional regulator
MAETTAAVTMPALTPAPRRRAAPEPADAAPAPTAAATDATTAAAAAPTPATAAAPEPAAATPPTAAAPAAPAPEPATPPSPATDRRSLRTRRMLREAFAQLTAERGLDGFSIGELTERADINRGTFYAHYRDMADLLRFFEDEIIADLQSLKPRIQAVTLKELLAFDRKGLPPQVTVELFDLLREHGHLLRVLLSPSGDASFQARLRDRICTDLVRSVLPRKYTKTPRPLTEYYIAYYASAMLGLIQRWLERDMPEDSEEMARILLSVMMLRPGDPIELRGRAR